MKSTIGVLVFLFSGLQALASPSFVCSGKSVSVDDSKFWEKCFDSVVDPNDDLTACFNGSADEWIDHGGFDSEINDIESAYNLEKIDDKTLGYTYEYSTDGYTSYIELKQCEPKQVYKYICNSVDDQEIKLELSATLTQSNLIYYMVNEEDLATIDGSYKPRSENLRDWKKLTGWFQSMGNQRWVVSSDIIVNPYLSSPELIKNSSYGLLEYRVRTSEDFYTSTLRCDKK